MQIDGIILIQKISQIDVELGGVICFKNKIVNNTNKVIKNIIFENISTGVLDKIYYEFKKNNDDISIEKNEEVLEIDYLNPKDELEIYITATLSKNNDKTNFMTFARLKYNTLEGKLDFLESNQNVLNILKENISEKSVFINADRTNIEFGDILSLEINIINKKNKILKSSQIEELIPNGTELVENSLKINNNTITIGDCIEKIKLGDLKPLHKVNIKLKVKLKNDQINFIDYKVNLCYMEVLEENFQNLSIESNILKINIVRADIELLEESLTKTTYKLNEEIVFKMKIRNVGTVNLDMIKISYSSNENLIINRAIESNKNTKLLNHELIVDTLLVESSEDISFLGSINKFGEYKNEDIKITFFYFDSNGIKKYKEKIIKSRNTLSIKNASLRVKECLIEKTSLFLGEKTKITFGILNEGNILAENIILKLNLQKGLMLENSYVSIDGNSEFINDSNVYIGSIAANCCKLISCYLKAVDVFEYEFSQNISIVKYEYILENKLYEDIVNLAIKNIFVSGPKVEVQFAKENDDYGMGLDERFEEHIKITNSGNLIAKNISIEQEKNDFIELDNNSIFVNGFKKEGIINNINNKVVLLGDLKPHKVIDIKYSINKRKLSNNAKYALNVSFENMINDIGETSSNILKLERDGIKIKEAIIEYVYRATTKKFVQIGEEITISTKLINKGNEKAYDVKLIEELPDGISLYNVEINEVNFEIKENIINLNVIDINETIDIKYKFIITDNFMKTQKINSKVCYKSLKNSIGDFKEKVSLNNSIIIEKYLVDIDIKIQRLDIGMLNGEEVYCVLLKNMGETNIENLSLQLNINTQMKYKVLVEEKEITNLTTLKKNEEIELRYKIKFEANRNFKDAQLECVLTGNYIYGDIVNEILIKRQSEIFIIDINEVNVTKEIFADYCFKGEDVEVLMKIENVGNSIVRNILLEDSIFNYDIVQDSFNINGQDLDYSIINSIMLDKIQPFEYSFVRFLVKTDNIEESYLKSITRIESEFCNHKKFETYIKSFNPFYINLKSIQIDVSTNFSKKEFIYNEKIFVNTLIKNLGDIEIYNIEIDDFISKDLEILKYNLYLDGKKINNFFKNKKILVPKICEKGICEIKRELWYVGLQSNENIEMFMMMNYEYKDKKNRMKRMQIGSEKNFLEGIINIRKKVKIESNINITMDRLKDINNINVKPKVSSSYLIDSLTTIKNDDEKFTGKKLIARGYIEIEIEYIAANLVENIYFQKEIKRFATYINLPKDFNENIFDLRIDANDISYEKISDNLIWSEVILDFNVII